MVRIISDPSDERRSGKLNLVPVAHLTVENQNQLLWHLYKPGVIIFIGISSPFIFL